MMRRVSLLGTNISALGLPSGAVVNVLAIALLIGGLACAEKPDALQSPEQGVVLITVDTLRADKLGSYGYGLQTSPNLDAMAKRGVGKPFRLIPV